ncbi:MAG: BNR repeat-containing protein [Planctomycetes bacterium]|nr:BNR repeat-containing protein [Planctomycetota bacterium]
MKLPEQTGRSGRPLSLGTPAVCRIAVILLAGVLVGRPSTGWAAETLTPPEVVEAVDIEPVWAGHRVGFCLLTHGDRQFAAYYDADRRMTVAGRTLGETRWAFAKLDSTLGWDSHNYVTMAVDRQGYLHVCGNMHVAPLVYFRSDRPREVSSLRRVPAMTGEAEQRVTYPKFFRTPAGALLFLYRDGRSGDGRTLVNVYDETSRTWRRYLDAPLFDGTARSMNAYPDDIEPGPDGRFHLVWMWRETPDCRSNLHISYARSRDLQHWETAAGKAVGLPLTPDNPDVVVDPTPAYRGLINVGFGVGFDPAQRPIVHYHKYDPQGNSQIYLARWEDAAWVIRPVSRWDYRWEFQGGGSIPVLVSAGPVQLLDDGRLVQSWSHVKYGSGTWQLDPVTLQIVADIRLPPRYPAALTRSRTNWPGLGVRWAEDLAARTERDRRYVLRWESLGANRDQPIAGPIPEPTMLTLYCLTGGQ